MNTRRVETRSQKTAMDTNKLGKPKQILSSTGDFRPIDVRSLNICYINAQSPDDLFKPLPSNIQTPEYLLVQNLSRDQLTLASDDSYITKQLNDDEKTIAKCIYKVLQNEA